MLAVGGVVFAITGSDGGASPSSLSARSLFSLALADASHGRWVHETIRRWDSHHVAVDNDEIGTHSGRQIWDQPDGSTTTVVVVDGEAFIRGDATSIVHFFEVPTSDPGGAANKWLSIPRSVPAYKSVASSVTLASDFSQTFFGGPYTRGPEETLHGVRVIPIHGFVSKTRATLYVTARGTVLPVELYVVHGAVHSRTEWSGWGRPVAIRPPTLAIPIADFVR